MDQQAAAVLAETATDDPWREKFKRHWLSLRGLGWEAMMLDKVQRQNKIVRETVQRQMNGTLGKPIEGQAVEEDDMAIRIGDEVHNHYSTPAPAPTPAAAPATPATAGMSALGKAALGAALALGGAGAGAAVVNALSGQPSTTVVAPSGVDTDTSVRITIPQEDRIE